MKNNFIKYSFLFFLLIFIQVVLFNNISLFGYAQPMIYILFIFLYPISNQRGLFLLLAFLLGLFVDFFSNSGGINAAATLFIAYIRFPVLKIVSNRTEFDPVLFQFNSLPFSKQISYLLSLTLIHHFIVFMLSYFKLSAFKYVVMDTMASSIFTLVLILFYSQFFLKKPR
jgi:rod shape-determining protein MreD